MINSYASSDRMMQVNSYINLYVHKFICMLCYKKKDDNLSLQVLKYLPSINMCILFVKNMTF